MSAPKRLDKFICAAPAALLGCLAILMVWRAVYHNAPHLRTPGYICAGLAALLLLTAEFTEGWLHRMQRAVSIIAINTAIIFGLAEVVCRVARVDFNVILGLKEKNEGFPIFFRLPDQPVGEVFFTRKGPASWTGKPLTVMLQNHRGNDPAYLDEKEITISYDKDGFRNPDDLKDWDIAITGDSFTESGYLPYEDLYSTQLGKLLGKRVKNLGVSDTGNFSQAAYLRAYGLAPSCRTAVLAFFEGNDLDDNIEEMRELQEYHATGERPCREIGRESSLLKTLYRFARDIRKINFSQRSYVNAIYNANGKEIPITIADAPPAPDRMSAVQRKSLQSALQTWATSCKESGVEPLLLYIPCKRRVFHGYLKPGRDYPEPAWQLNDLPAYVAREATSLGIRCVDSTPALTELAAKGVLTYNAIYDTHLNREGHRVVAEVLAKALANVAPVQPAISASSR
ncbi:MAG: hypothetical protein K8R87_13250 [Verrucomicrobia bacterium]|nr:hypothetical protein [Verrucomicrobiota bacterium]